MAIVRRTDAQRILFDWRFEATLRCASLRIVAATGLCVVSACAPLPFRGARFSEASLAPTDAAAMVHVYHRANYLTWTTAIYQVVDSKANTYSGMLTERLYVDGKNSGLLTYYAANGLFRLYRLCEYISVTLPPGSHEFPADYDPPFHVWSGLSRVPIAAAATRVDLEAGQTYWIRISSEETYTLVRQLTGIRKLGHTVEAVDRETGLRDIADCTLTQTP